MTDNQIFHIFVAVIIPFIGALVKSFWHYNGTILGEFVRPQLSVRIKTFF